MYVQEMFGHIEGMLNRDLRTTKTLCISVRTQNQCRDSTLADCRNVGVSHVFPRKNKRFQQRRNSYAWNSLQRFKHILVFGVYLLSILNLPSSLSRPIHARMEKEWWIMDNNRELGTSNSSSKCNIVKLMCDMAKIVKTHASEYQSSDLLPIGGEVTWSIPAFFPVKGDEVDSHEFENIAINEFAVNIYNDLQKYALGLDIMFRYQDANRDNDAGKKKDKTKSLINYLKSLLYEINEYFNAFNINKKEDVHSTDYEVPDMDLSKFTKFSYVLIEGFVENVVYTHTGLTYYNQTECN